MQYYIYTNKWHTNWNLLADFVNKISLKYIFFPDILKIAFVMIPFRNLSQLSNVSTKSMRKWTKWFRKSSHLRSQKLQNTQAVSIKIRPLAPSHTKQALTAKRETLKTKTTVCAVTYRGTAPLKLTKEESPELLSQ